MTVEDAPPPPPDAPPSAAPQPIQLDITVVLPEDVATFGLLEHVSLPPDIFESLRLESMQPLLAEALVRVMQQTATRLAVTLTAVLIQRAGVEVPIDHDAYVAHQQDLLDGRADAQKLARAAAEEAANRA
jgi:hypothetical protein